MLVQLSFLISKIKEAILEGKQPPHIRLNNFLGTKMSMLWDEQLIILNGAMNPENIQPSSESTQRLFNTIDPFRKGINLDEASRAIADVNAADKRTVLHNSIRHAIMHENTTILEKIVQHPDINVNVVNESGWSYFHHLVQLYSRSPAE